MLLEMPVAQVGSTAAVGTPSPRWDAARAASSHLREFCSGPAARCTQPYLQEPPKAAAPRPRRTGSLPLVWALRNWAHAVRGLSPSASIHLSVLPAWRQLTSLRAAKSPPAFRSAAVLWPHKEKTDLLHLFYIFIGIRTSMTGEREGRTF